MSENPLSGLAPALLEAQKEMPDLQRNAINPHFGSSFISLDSLMDQILPILNAHDIILLQAPTYIPYDGGIEPALRTTLFHAPSGEQISETMPTLPAKDDPQGQGSAITYARRYGLMSLLGLVADQDDDANASTASRRSSTRSSGTARKPKPKAAAAPQTSGGDEDGPV